MRSAVALLVAAVAFVPAAAQERWILEEVARVGSLDEPLTALAPIRSLTVDRAGRVYVIQRGVASVEVFDERGHVATLGGPGSGPGEFRTPSALGWLAGDTLWVDDMASARVSFWHDLRYAGSVNLPMTGRARYQALGVASRDLLVVAPQFAARTLASEEGLPVYKISARGVALDTLARMDLYRPIVEVVLAPDRFAYMRAPVTYRDFVQVTNGGRLLTMVSPVEKDRQVIRVTRIDVLTGDTLSLHEVQAPGRPVSRDAVERHIRRITEGQDAAVARAYRRAVQPVPRFESPIDISSAGEDGTTWVRSNRTWYVFDQDGNRAILERAPDVWASNGEHVWGVAVGRLEEPYLVKYRIVKH